ncbi:MAG: lipid 4-phosphatase [Thermodesulfobacteriota bacterium]|nr:lipid 4-phosphatase [Thermodesulfobacteriota bacterium]
MNRAGSVTATVLMLLCLGIGSTFIVMAQGLDLTLSRYFFSKGGAEGGWALGAEQPWKFLYRYGEVPGILLLVGVLVALAGTLLDRVSFTWKKPCLVVVLTILLGPGLLVNGILKNGWGRPRPADITAFGGTFQYRDAWPPCISCSGKSFTCGHCAIGFSMSSGAVLFLHNPLAAWTVVALGMTYGFLLGFGRLAQGGHFLTDVIWSFVLVYVVMALVYYFMFRVPNTHKRFFHGNGCWKEGSSE